MNLPPDIYPELLQKAKTLGVNPQDIEESFVAGGGKGGQKINKTASCVMLRYPPKGIIIRCQKHREQSKNRLSAFKLLLNKVEEQVKGRESARAKKIFKLRKQKLKRSKRAKEKMLDSKSRHGEIKQNRKSITL